MKIEAHGKILLFTLWALIVSFFLVNIARAGDPIFETEKFYATNLGGYQLFGHAVAISGNIVVWEDQRTGNLDIYGYDLSSKSEFVILSRILFILSPLSNLVIAGCPICT